MRRVKQLPFVIALLVVAVVVAAGCGDDDDAGGSGASANAGAGDCDKRFRVGFMPKQTADPFFVAANEGAQEAAKELNLDVIYKGPPSPDPAGQTQIITQWTQQHLDAISPAANDPDALAPALKQAADAGIKVSAWNADVAPDAREFFMDNPPARVLGKELVEQTVSSTGKDAKILVMTSSLQSPNQNQFLEAVKDYAAEKYPDLVIQKVLAGQSDTAHSFNIAKSWLQAHPETTGILTVDGSELAGGAQAVNQLGKKGKVTLVGIGVPSQNGNDLLSGTVKAVILWNPIDLGYATMQMVHAQLCGTLKKGQKTFSAGRLGELEFTSPDTITLGKPLVFTKENVKDYDF